MLVVLFIIVGWLLLAAFFGCLQGWGITREERAPETRGERAAERLWGHWGRWRGGVMSSLLPHMDGGDWFVLGVICCLLSILLVVVILGWVFPS